MPLGELCAAAIEYSDNTAGNLLLQTIGGPGELTRYLRSLGDETTRLDRNEPSLNTAIKGDVRDTTTPASMLHDMERLLIRDALSTGAKQQLETWLLANTTGAKRLRAGLPNNWRIGDKTGTGENGATNDIAIVWPPDRAPILVTAFLVESTVSSADREAAIADVARLIAAERD
jgi:beta-lactamase class A